MRRSVREACLWSAGLAEPGVTRRATILDRAEQITDAEPDECPVGAGGPMDRRPRRRGGARRVWCATTARGTGCGSSTPTSPTCPATGCPTGCAASRCSTSSAYGERRLRQALAAQDVGAVEILVRGVDVDPDALRLRLQAARRPAAVGGDHPNRVGPHSRAVAFVCRPSR